MFISYFKMLEYVVRPHTYVTKMLIEKNAKSENKTKQKQLTVKKSEINKDSRQILDLSSANFHTKIIDKKNASFKMV